jgi:hypothetical protein
MYRSRNADHDGAAVMTSNQCMGINLWKSAFHALPNCSCSSKSLVDRLGDYSVEHYSRSEQAAIFRHSHSPMTFWAPITPSLNGVFHSGRWRMVRNAGGQDVAERIVTRRFVNAYRLTLWHRSGAMLFHDCPIAPCHGMMTQSGMHAHFQEDGHGRPHH